MPQAKHAYTTPCPRLPRALTPSTRRLVESAVQAHQTAIDGLIAFLDEMDGDPDLEPQCEDEGAACEDEGAEHDGREPSLGALNPSPERSQTGWANHGEEDMGL